MSEYVYQYHHAPLYLDRYEALLKAGSSYASESEEAKMVMQALSDKFWNIRILAIKNIAPLAKKKKEQTKAELVCLAKSDEKSAVRSAAIEALAKYYTDVADTSGLKTLFNDRTDDSSYDVSSTALDALAKLSADDALALASTMEKSSNAHALSAVADLYAEHGKAKNAEFFPRAYSQSEGFGRYEILMSYGVYLRKADTDIIAAGIPFITDKARTGEPWWLRLAAVNSLTEIAATLEKKSTAGQNDSPEEQHSKLAAKKLLAEVRDAIEYIKKKETNKKLVKIYQGKD
jgi:aminopeptidase N